MKFLRQILTPPIFDDEIKTQQAYLLHVILWALIVLPFPFLLYSLILPSDSTFRIMLEIGIGTAINLFLLLLVRRGYVRAVAILLVLSLWLLFTITAISGAGIQSIGYTMGYILVIIVAGILLGGKGAAITTLLMLISGGLIAYSQIHELLIPKFDNNPLSHFMVSLIIFPVIATLQYLSNRITHNAVARAHTSEERYRLISQVSSDYTFSTELDESGNMHLNWVAGAFEEITGFTYEEYVSTGGWQAHLYPDDVEKDAHDLAKIQTNQKVVTEIRTLTKGRELRWMRVYGHPVWDEEHNKLKGIFGAVQDITEQKQAEEALRKSEAIYRRAIEVAGGVPYQQTFDEKGGIHYDFMSEGIRQITGYGPDEFTDTLWDSLLVQERHLLDDLAEYSLDDAIQKVRSGKNPIWKCEHLIKARDGKNHWVFEAAVDLRDEHGNAQGSIGLYQDITERKQAEEALRYERDLLQIFMDNIPDTVYFKDTESRFVRINKTQAEFLKLNDPREAIGKTDLDFQPGELAQQFTNEEKHIIETAQPIINRIESNPTKDGKPRWFSTTKVPVKDSSGRVIGTIGVSRNITELKLAEAREDRRREILEKVVQLGKQVTKVSDLKTTLEKIWHGVHDELGFDRLAIFLYDQETHSIKGSLGTSEQGEIVEEWDYSRSLSQEKPTSFTRALEQPDGVYFTHNFGMEFDIPEKHEMHAVKDFAAVTAWAGDKPVAIITVDNHPSQRSITKEQLEVLRLFAGYAGLAIQNSRLNAALQTELDQSQTLIDELETKNAELERFTYTVSHDLKSPLVTITGFLGYLEQDAASGDKARVKSNINRISGAARKMQALLNDLLELSRIGRIMNPPEDFPFEEIVNEAIDRLHGSLEELDAVVEIQTGFPIVNGDRVRLVEVIQNLVENAIKYAKPGDRPRIEIGMRGVNEKGYPTFFVRDNGIGIEPQYHERIFGLFNKLDPQSEGTGVGLALVKRIVEFHGGRIWVESKAGMGSTFLFTLPSKPGPDSVI